MLNITQILSIIPNPDGGEGMTAYQAAKIISKATGRDRVAVENVLSRWKNGRLPNLEIAELYLGSLGLELVVKNLERDS
jgi:hypothetical protein